MSAFKGASVEKENEHATVIQFHKKIVLFPKPKAKEKPTLTLTVESLPVDDKDWHSVLARLLDVLYTDI